MPFKPVPTRPDYVQLEHDVQSLWDEHDVMQKYLQRNQHAEKRWSFIDGPITANNPMGVHHAWGRAYKDLYNRFWTMRGYKLRYQNGFDGQGLWIEVEVEKEKGFRSKRDIERFGVAEFVEACKQRVLNFSDRITQQSIRLGYWMDWDNSYQTMSDENNYSIWAFLKTVWLKGWLYKGKDTMPWCPSCGTGMSQQEIVTEGYQETTHTSVYLKFPITGRMEGVTPLLDPLPAGGEGERPGLIVHPEALEGRDPGGATTSALVPEFSPSPSTGRGPGGGVPPQPGESLLVWTTTPWTLVANVAAAVNPELTYLRVKQVDDVFYVSKGALAEAVRGEHEVLGEVPGSALIGLTYSGPFDEVPAQQGIVHRVIRWDEVSDAEGTGIVHIAPGAGAEDFALSKQYGLDVIAPLEEDGTYTAGGGFGFLEGKHAGEVPEDVFASLREKGLLYRVHDYTHRYPHCWRCGSELVFRLVDEWFISMDGNKGPDGRGLSSSTSGAMPTPSGLGAETATSGVSAMPTPSGVGAESTSSGVGGHSPSGTDVQPDALRYKIMETTRKARWIPEFGEARELDWLRNMHDWMISKKRYYGLALPIYECHACGNFEVIGSEMELRARAVEGWSEFEGHSPHRPYVDAVKIACGSCGATVERIKDVGNPWLDAGIVPFSTLNYRHDPEYWQQWFPADWVSESFPGQFRNWFYAMLAIGTVMVLDTEYEGTPPFRTLFSYALLRDEHGEEMHKSKGNAIWFEDAAERMGADIMRWMFLRAQPANNLNFGWHGADELKRGFLSTLWNTYSFFVTYANIDGWAPGLTPPPNPLPAGGEGERTEQAARAEALEGRGSGEAGLTDRASSSSPSLSTGRGLGGGVSPALTELDRWALSELNQLVATVTDRLENYDAMTACRQIEDFVEALSNWYVRRSRRRFWKSESDAEKAAAYSTLWTCLTTVNRLMAPMMPFVAEDMYQNLVGTRNKEPGTREEQISPPSPPAGRGLGGGVPPESIHLCDWPEADDALIDRELSAGVRVVQRLTSLGRAARAKANIKVRQPLATVHVKLQSSSEAESVRRMADQVLEELNVKSLEVVTDDSDLFEYQVLPNLPVLGPKYGREVGKIQAALRQADKASIAREAGAGRHVTLDGIELLPDELLVSMAGKPGYAVAEEAGYAVAVTTEITRALADEGLARELVRRVQEMRKTAGFEIADRIRVRYEGDAEVARVLEEPVWRDYVSQETLAASIAAGNGADSGSGHAEDHEIDGRKVRLAVEKV